MCARTCPLLPQSRCNWCECTLSATATRAPMLHPLPDLGSRWQPLVPGCSQPQVGQNHLGCSARACMPCHDAMKLPGCHGAPERLWCHHFDYLTRQCENIVNGSVEQSIKIAVYKMPCEASYNCTSNGLQDNDASAVLKGAVWKKLHPGKVFELHPSARSKPKELCSQTIPLGIWIIYIF